MTPTPVDQAQPLSVERQFGKNVAIKNRAAVVSI
jgi:hypothetical protein